MNERKYEVILDERVIARDMTIENAMIFVKALFDYVHSDEICTISIKTMPFEVE